MTSDDLEQWSVDLCWRQWTALGVAGVVRQESNAVVDPEALVLLTAALGDADPRLRDEATDWCSQFGQRFLSATRLRNLLVRAPELRLGATTEFLATVNANSNVRWPTPEGATPRPVTLSGKSQLPSIRKDPALLRLQLRALFGVTARAEILLVLLTSPASAWFSVADLVATGYTKRHVALVLGDLALAGLLAERKLGKALRYRLEQRPFLEKLAPGSRTAIQPRWDLRFRVVIAAQRMRQATSAMSAATRSIEARELVTTLEQAWQALELAPPPIVDPRTYQADLIEWIQTDVVPRALF